MPRRNVAETGNADELSVVSALYPGAWHTPQKSLFPCDGSSTLMSVTAIYTARSQSRKWLLETAQR